MNLSFVRKVEMFISELGGRSPPPFLFSVWLVYLNSQKYKVIFDLKKWIIAICIFAKILYLCKINIYGDFSLSEVQNQRYY